MNNAAGQLSNFSFVPEKMVTITKIENGYIVQRAFPQTGRVFANNLEEVNEIVEGIFDTEV